MHHKHHAIAIATLALTAASLTACGGGSDTPEAVTPAPSNPFTLTGKVFIDGAVKNAVVCMDLNANNTCDATEPTSAKTGADGAYSITYDNTKVSATDVAASSLISPQTVGTATDGIATIDMANPTETNNAAFVLKQVPGKSGQINPLSTLIAAGISAGMTEAVARTNASTQLGIDVAKLDDYQSEPPASDSVGPQDNARWAAKMVAAALEIKDELVVGDPSKPSEAASGDLASLTFTDANNYNGRLLDSLARAAGTGQTSTRDNRFGAAAGAPLSADQLYRQAYLTNGGWLRCDDKAPIVGTLGSPSRTVFCGSLTQGGFTTETSIADRLMSDVITEMQSDSSSNTINNGVPVANLLAAVGTAKFPAGSAIRQRFSTSVNQPIFINNLSTDGRPQAEATTLEGLIAARPASSVNLATGSGTLSLGISSGNAKALRVAFTGVTSATQGAVQFYDCDLNSTQTVISNCVTAGTGGYAISTVNGSKVMRFTGHTPTVMNHTRLYVEVKNVAGVVNGDWVYQARENKPSFESNFSTSKRINSTAWSALRSTLKI